MSQADEEDLPLSPQEEAELLEALEAALRPTELDPDVNERLIESALEDPLAPPSEAELVESARLRDALEQRTPHEDAGLLAALRAPFSEPSAESDAGQAVMERALQAALGEAPKSERRPRNVIYALFGAGSAILTAAAAALLFLPALSRSSAPGFTSADAAALVKPHSTAPLFTDRFDTGGTTARMDLIASVRSRDLRDNRYAAWGVR